MLIQDPMLLLMLITLHLRRNCGIVCVQYNCNVQSSYSAQNLGQAIMDLCSEKEERKIAMMFILLDMLMELKLKWKEKQVHC